MPRITSLVSSSALIGSVFLLTGCPPPPDLTQWQRPGSTIDDARVAMGQCGVPLPGPELKWSTKTGHSFRVFPEQSL